jgi:hypothetical protein
LRQYDEISRASHEAREILSREPAVARVIAEDDQGKVRTIYICRTTPIQIIHQFASYSMLDLVRQPRVEVLETCQHSLLAV